MARIDIEIEDYLDEVDTETLVKELAGRKDLTKELLSKYLPEIFDTSEI